MRRINGWLEPAGLGNSLLSAECEPPVPGDESSTLLNIQAGQAALPQEIHPFSVSVFPVAVGMWM